MRAGNVGGLLLMVAALPFALAACGTPDVGHAGSDPTGTRTSATAQSAARTAGPAQSPSQDAGAPLAKASPSTTLERRPPAPPALTRTVAAEHVLNGPYPPRSTLSYADQTQAGRTSSFTWTSCEAGGCRTMHADAPGITIPPAEERLTVPAGAVLTFVFGGKNRPTILSVTAYVLDDQSPRHAGPRSTGPSWLQRWGQRATALPWRQAGLQVAVTADLPAAEYIIVVDLRERGDPAAWGENEAPYGFRVVVQSAVAPPTSTASATATEPPGTPPIDPATGRRQCGKEFNRHGQGIDAAARDCLWRAYLAGQPAEFTTTALTVEGDPITHTIVIAAPGRIEVTVDSKDRFGRQGVFRYTCQRLERPSRAGAAPPEGFMLRGCPGVWNEQIGIP